MSHRVAIQGLKIRTPRLQLRPWDRGDAAGAMTIYGDAEIARWLAPAMDQVRDIDQMRSVISAWANERAASTSRPTGRWAIELAETGQIIGSGQIVGLPPGCDDLEIGYQFARSAWGQGLASEAGHALAHYAFASGEEELFAVVRTHNERAIRTARRIGMEWVGETEKYYDLRLQVFRLRNGDLDSSLLEPSPIEH